MYKKSQVTIFVILGIIILILVSLLMYYKPSVHSKEMPYYSNSTMVPPLILPAQNPISAAPSLVDYQRIPFEEDSIKEYLIKCMTNQLKSNLEYMASQGGMFIPGAGSVMTAYGMIASYPFDVNPADVRLNVENQISLAAKSALEQCLDLESSGDFPNLEVDFGQMSTVLSSNDIKMSLLESIILKTEYAELEIDDLSVTLPTNYDKIIAVKENIIRQNSNDPEWLDLEYMTSLEFPVSIMPYAGEAVIYSIEYSQNPEANYIFAITSDSNSAPKLEYVPDLRLKKDATWSYALMATDYDGDEIFYYCNSDDCNVDAQTGELTYSASSAGIKTITVGARDADNKFSEQEVKIYVET